MAQAFLRNVTHLLLWGEHPVRGRPLASHRDLVGALGRPSNLWPDRQICRREIIACCEHRLTSHSCQRIHGAIAEIELRPVAHSFAKATKSRNRQPGLDFIEGDHLAHQFVYKLVEQNQRSLAIPCPKNDAGLE